MNASRNKGTAWETAIVNYLRTVGRPHVERRAKNGNKDRGDIAGVPGIVIEAKAAATWCLPDWWKETQIEKANDGARYGFMWLKRRGKSSVGEGWVIMDGNTFTELLKEAGW